MTPTEVASKLRQLNEVLERVASLPRHITPEQAPDDMHKYCQEAAEGYADGWNDCMKAMRGEGE